MADNNLEVFAIQFAKLVQIQELVRIDKEIDVAAFVKGTSAIAEAKGDAFAFGPNSHTETLALTKTDAVEGLFSKSASIAESVSAATKAWDFHM
jgi:hypothetical protein